MKKKVRATARDKITEVIAWFMGSWWGVAFHTLWFSIWLIFRFDLNLLTLWVSLEAIFIGIFLLMASNQAEEARDRREVAARKRMMRLLRSDVELDNRAEVRQRAILQAIGELKAEMEKLRQKVEQH